MSIVLMTIDNLSLIFAEQTLYIIFPSTIDCNPGV